MTIRDKIIEVLLKHFNEWDHYACTIEQLHDLTDELQSICDELWDEDSIAGKIRKRIRHQDEPCHVCGAVKDQEHAKFCSAAG